ncbi:MAG: hypothetical protein IAE80_01340 [Anaerolinea sp.]|nr:hypothetical protein [Anaerolinea sp.]
MGYQYRVIGLVPPEVNVDFESIVAAVRVKFSQRNLLPEIIRTATTCELRYQDWSIRIFWSDGDDVLSVSEEIAQHAKVEAEDKLGMTKCTRHVSTAADPDPSMTHFNDYVFVVEVLESFPGIYLLDPYDGTLLT